MPFLGTCDPNAQGAHMEDVFLVELETYNPMLCRKLTLFTRVI